MTLTYKKVEKVQCKDGVYDIERQYCINRDTNGVKNIRRIVEHYLKTKERLPIFQRENNMNDESYLCESSGSQ